MKLTTVRCNECGAPLQITETTRFANCAHCGSQLSVQRSEGALFTEKIAEQVGQIAHHTANIAEHTASIAQHTSLSNSKLEALRLQGAIEKLDREWQEARLPFFTNPRTGKRRQPGDGMVPGAILMIVSLFLFAGGSSKGETIPFGVILLLGGMIAFWGGSMNKRRYQEAHGAYKNKRHALETELSRLG